MPNWTYNRIKCKKEIGDKLLTIKNDIYSLDFNKLIPMPEDLKLDAGSIESDSISCYYLSLNDDEIDLITRVIASHMGIWNRDYNGNEVLPIPKDKYQRFVHMCDYLSSKKFINVKFDGMDISDF